MTGLGERHRSTGTATYYIHVSPKSLMLFGMDLTVVKDLGYQHDW